MPRLELWNRSPSRIELDHRARDARQRLEQIERLLVALSARARLPHRRRTIRLRLRGFSGYDADRQGECPPPGIARPPSSGTRAADPVMRPAASVWPDGGARPLRQAA